MPSPIGVAVAFASLGTPPFVYASASRWAREDGFWKRRYDNTGLVNTHDATEYVVNPNKRHFRDVERYASLLFDTLPAGAIYIDDDSRHYYAITMYDRRYYGRRPDLDVRLVGPDGTRRATTGPMVVAPRSASIAASLPVPDGGRGEAWTVRARVGSVIVKSSVTP